MLIYKLSVYTPGGCIRAPLLLLHNREVASRADDPVDLVSEDSRLTGDDFGRRSSHPGRWPWHRLRIFDFAANFRRRRRCFGSLLTTSGAKSRGSSSRGDFQEISRSISRTFDGQSRHPFEQGRCCSNEDFPIVEVSSSRAIIRISRTRVPYPLSPARSEKKSAYV